MAIKTSSMRNSLASEYATLALFGAVYTSAPGSTAGAEVSGGSPAYARKGLVWSSPTDGVITATAEFDIPENTTVMGVGVHSEVTGGEYLDGNTVVSQNFATQGTLTVTFTYTQS